MTSYRSHKHILMTSPRSSGHNGWGLRMTMLVILHLCRLCLGIDDKPARRSLLYLHTTPTSWSSARDTCAGYGGHLVHNKNTDSLWADVFVLDHFLDWTHTFSSLSSAVWTGLYHNTTDSVSYWDRCGSYEKHEVSDDVKAAEKDMKKDVDRSCMAVDPAEHASPLVAPCHNHLPYICQVDEGECWFLPIDQTALSADPSTLLELHKTVKECAGRCRDHSVGACGAQCWGFTFWDEDGGCDLYLSNIRHAPLQNIASSLHEVNNNVTAYIKICTGGRVTDMAPLSSHETVAAHESCLGVDEVTDDDWTDDVCYCPCDSPPIERRPSSMMMTVDQQVGEIHQRLAVNPGNTSRAHRKLKSAEDSRTSSTSIGTAGIALLSILLAAILIFDLRILAHHVTDCITGRSYRWMTSSTSSSPPPLSSYRYQQ